MQRTIRIAATALAVALALQGQARAALIEGTGRSDVLVGRDDDNQADAEIQAGASANQSLDNADTIVGGRGDDILIGMLGSDVLLGGPGDDILIGGIEGGSRPNQDIQIGDTGNDIALWQAGDGSDLFDGGPARATRSSSAPSTATPTTSPSSRRWMAVTPRPGSPRLT